MVARMTALARTAMAARLLRRLLLAGLPLLARAGPCSVGRPSSQVCHLNNSETMEYELRWTHGWQWFVLRRL